jgi:type IV secretory pathway TrbD component
MQISVATNKKFASLFVVLQVVGSHLLTVRVKPRLRSKNTDHLGPMSRLVGATVLLRLRWLQLRRAFPAYGVVLLALASLGVLGLMHRAMLRDPGYAAYMAGGALLVVVGLHQQRKDLHFLQRHVPQARQAMAVEYGVLVLPILLVLFLAGSWPVAVVPIVAVALPWLPVVRSSGVRGKWLRRGIPVRLFEWRGLVQATHPLGLVLWLSALASCWLPVLPLFLLGIIVLWATSAQEQCEPRAMLLATAEDAHSFLRTKLWGAMRLMAVVLLPVLAAATFFHPGWWWVHAGFGLGMWVLVAYAVVLKYANYRPDQRLEANSANVAVAALFSILPGLSVVPLVMLFTEMPKARANLSAYFHDHRC